MHARALSLGLLFAVTTVGTPAAPPRDLSIYFIDVEGGASTLVVTPAGQSVLFDAGWGRADNRDLNRILAAMKDAGVTRIDYLVLSHFHADHAGGVGPLAKAVHIGEFYDHGESVEPTNANTAQNYADYLAAAGSHRHVVQPGDKIPLTGVDFRFVIAHAQTVAAPAGAPANPLCASYSAHAIDPTENAQSVGWVLESGKFRFAAVGDLSWNSQYPLACPANLLGRLDLVEAPHHASREDYLPMLWSATTPLAVVANNGSRKGGDTAAMAAIPRTTGLKDWWSLHRKFGADSAHNALEQFTANLSDTTDCAGAWIKASANADGSFTLTNGRNHVTRTYRR
jgi:hypothetical protein